MKSVYIIARGILVMAAIVLIAPKKDAAQHGREDIDIAQ